MNPEINVEEMPRHEEYNMITTIVETAKKWFKLPEVQEDFRRWQEERRENE